MNRAVWKPVALGAGAVVLWALVFLQAVNQPALHDEHQFLAPARLLVDEGLLPYVDYPYFHTPYLIAPYALLAELTDHLYLAARAFSAVCSWALLVLIAAWVTHGERRRRSERFWHRVVALLAVGLVLGSNLFQHTSGLIWNHDLSLLLVVSACLVFIRSQGSSRPHLHLVCSGVLLGLSVGVRLSTAPLYLPLAGLLAFSRCPTGGRWRGLLAFHSGLTVATLPLLFFLVFYTDDFLFGNLTYPKLNTLYRARMGWTVAMTLTGKLDYLARRVFDQLTNALVLVFLVVTCVGHLAARWAKPKTVRLRWETRVLLFCLPFAVAGAWAPTPSFDQYYYPFVPLLVLLSVSLLRDQLAGRWVRIALAALGLLALIVALDPVRHRERFSLHPRNWTPVQTRMLAHELRGVVASGRVLTLSPTIPLEAGLRIYPQLATGPFAWRIGRLLDDASRRRHTILSPGSWLAALGEPPAAILVGGERRRERGLVRFARRSGYRATRLDDRYTVWVRPPRPAAEPRLRRRSHKPTDHGILK
jgi:hypothetical protein